jgi:hypothetical protein
LSQVDAGALSRRTTRRRTRRARPRARPGQAGSPPSSHSPNMRPRSSTQEERPSFRGSATSKGKPSLHGLSQVGRKSTKTRFSRKRSVLRSHLFYLAQPHISFSLSVLYHGTHRDENTFKDELSYTFEPSTRPHVYTMVNTPTGCRESTCAVGTRGGSRAVALSNVDISNVTPKNARPHIPHTFRLFGVSRSLSLFDFQAYCLLQAARYCTTATRSSV